MTQRLTKIIGITFGVQVGVFLFSLVNNVLLSRWLGPANLGIVALFFLFTEAIHKISNMGLETSALYFTSNQRFAYPTLLGTTFINGLLTVVLGSALILAFVHFHGLTLFFEAPKAAILSQGKWWSILLLFAYMAFDYSLKLTLGHQRFLLYNRVMFIRPILFFIFLMIIYWRGMLSAWAVLGIYSASWLLPALYLWIQELPFPLIWNREISWEMWRYGIKVMFSNLLAFLNYRVDVFMVAYFLGEKAVGWYYVAILVSEKLHYLTQSTSTIFFPAASRSSEQHRKTPIIARTNVFAVALGAGLLAIAAPWLVPLVFSHRYDNSVLPLILALPGIVALTIPRVLSADFSSKGRPEFSVYAALVSLVSNVILNLFFIPRWGIVGAAISSSIGYILAAVLMLIFYRKLTGTALRKVLIPLWSDWQELKEI